MTLRYKLTLRFAVIVLAILTIAMLSIYVFTNYFLNKNFYFRLNNRAVTVANWLSQTIDKKEEVDLLKSLLTNRRDQLPNEEIIVYDFRNEIIFSTNSHSPTHISPQILAYIRKNNKIQFQPADFDAVGIYYHSQSQSYVVIALAQNVYGQSFLIQMKWMMCTLLFVGILVITLIGWIYAKKTLEPIEQIGSKLNRVFPANLNQRLEYVHEDEIGNLAKTINQLLDRVEDGILIQKMFIGNISHELQNPLTRISSQLEVVSMKERTIQDYQDTINSVFEDISELIQLTKNLLSLSRVNIDKDELLVNKIRIDELLFEVQAIIHRNFSYYQVIINLDTMPEEPEHLCLMGNADLLKIAMLNLVENACKFSENNTAVISLFSHEVYKKITISDTGVGISFDELSKIFQPFYRSKKNAQTKGYGIGLSMVDRIIKIHNATIGVKSELGVGTAFTIIFETKN